MFQALKTVNEISNKKVITLHVGVGPLLQYEKSYVREKKQISTVTADSSGQWMMFDIADMLRML